MSTYTFIGDVHGWPRRLEQVLTHAQGHIVYVGDLIDRGPNSRAVVERVMRQCHAGQASSVMGNHEYAIVRSIGVPELGITSDERLCETWYNHYGGAETAASYGVVWGPEFVPALRQAMGEHLMWMAKLPWFITGQSGDQHFICTHAGLHTGSWEQQLDDMNNVETFWSANSPLPAALYAKDRVRCYPEDLPSAYTIISGHVPNDEVFLSDQRIVCDTSGGLSAQVLSGVIWPHNTIICSERTRVAGMRLDEIVISS